MQTEKNKKIGVGIMVLAALSFFFFFWYFGMDGAKIDFESSALVKSGITVLIPIVGLYFGLLLYGGRRLANRIGGFLALFMATSYLIAFLRVGI